MAAGTFVQTQPIAYAGFPILLLGGRKYYTSGLLSAFTDVSNATPNGKVPGYSGDIMKPVLITPLTQNEPCYRVFYGTYAGTYSINRNDPQGEIFYTNWNITGSYSLADFGGYIHWPGDQRLAMDLANNTGDNYDFKIKIPSYNLLMDLAGYTPGNYSTTNPLDNYSSLPNNSGAYSPSTINTGWTLNFSIGYPAINNPGGIMNWDIGVIDYHSGDDLGSPGTLTVGGPISGQPQVQNFSINVDYWRCPLIRININ